MNKDRITEIIDIMTVNPQTPYYPNICNELIQTVFGLLDENKKLKEELQKADSITQSCIFDGKEESQLNYRKAIKMIEELHNKIEEANKTIDTNLELI